MCFGTPASMASLTPRMSADQKALIDQSFPWASDYTSTSDLFASMALYVESAQDPHPKVCPVSCPDALKDKVNSAIVLAACRKEDAFLVVEQDEETKEYSIRSSYGAVMIFGLSEDTLVNYLLSMSRLYYVTCLHSPRGRSRGLGGDSVPHKYISKVTVERANGDSVDLDPHMNKMIDVEGEDVGFKVVINLKKDAPKLYVTILMGTEDGEIMYGQTDENEDESPKAVLEVEKGADKREIDMGELRIPETLKAFNDGDFKTLLSISVVVSTDEGRLKKFCKYIQGAVVEILSEGNDGSQESGGDSRGKLPRKRVRIPGKPETWACYQLGCRWQHRKLQGSRGGKPNHMHKTTAAFESDTDESDSEP